MRSLVAAFRLLVVACGIWFPDQGSNPGPLHWEQDPQGSPDSRAIEEPWVPLTP